MPNKLTVKLPPFFYYHPDHCYGILLRNKVSVKLPMFSITVSTIARTVVFPRLSSYYRRITAITIELPRSPSLYREHRRINAFTVEYRNCRRFSLISKSLPRFLVIEYVYRQIADVLPYRPDHYREVSLPDKFYVELPPFPLPSETLPRYFFTEQVYGKITAVFHSHPDHCRGGLLPSKFTVKLPTFYITIPTTATVSHCGTRLALNYQRFPLPSRPLRLRAPSDYRVYR